MYKDGEILAAEQVASVTGFDDTNVGRGTKWKYINSGGADHYAILRKGQHTETYIANRQKEKKHRTIIQVLQRVKDNLTDRYDDLLDHADNIIARLETRRLLGDTGSTVFDANITGGDEVKELWIRETLAWIYVDIYLDWQEQYNVTFAE